MFMALIRNLLNSKGKDHFYNCLYGFMHFFIVYWLYFIALFKVFVQRNRAWGTR